MIRSVWVILYRKFWSNKSSLAENWLVAYFVWGIRKNGSLDDLSTPQIPGSEYFAYFMSYRLYQCKVNFNFNSRIFLQLWFCPVYVTVPLKFIVPPVRTVTVMDQRYPRLPFVMDRPLTLPHANVWLKKRSRCLVDIYRLEFFKVV